VSPLAYTREGWVPPWREGLEQRVCVECSKLVVAITMTRSTCHHCTVKLGVKPEEPPPELQLEIPLF
jgi:DNA-directed RNA polymerase subunit RPC12/RpoP